jgi:tRNA/tmRNA/rRNA uracil-C5-methylase (TrmA/RlmC/RlmD family)
MRAGEILSKIVIEGVDDEGRGRGHVGSFDVAVRGAFPGDVVDRALIEVVFAQRQLAQARRLSPPTGPLHIERTCGHAGPCAACPLHGVDEGFAQALKQERVRRAFSEAFADAGLRSLVVDDVVAGEGLRQKIKLVSEGGRLGHYVPHTHALAPALLCGHTRDAIVDVVVALQERLAGLPVKAVIAREFKEGVGVVVVGSGPAPDLQRLRVAHCSGIAWRRDDEHGSSSLNSLLAGSVVDVDGDLLGSPLDGGPRCAVDAFCQADLVGAARLLEIACDFVVVDAGGLFFDLYAGTGAFARALLARGAERVVAIEVSEVSVRALSSIAGVVAVQGRVEDVVDRLRSEGTPRGLVVDPPKKGLAAAAVDVAGLGAARVALVSCDVDAGARDARAFVEAGYAIARVVPVDLFPGSSEVEVLTLLERRGPGAG